MQLNKLCNLEDWDADTRAATMRRILPYFAEAYPTYPAGMQHRKHWEFAQILDGLDQLDALPPDGLVLGVAAGHEEVLFDLTNRVRWVFATDIYGIGAFAGYEANQTMLQDPESFARCPHNRNRLVVQYMDALDLRHEDETFDAVYSLSSIEHFGAEAGAVTALDEQRRVVKDGGIVAFTTEVIVNDAPTLNVPDLTLFRPEQLADMCGRLDGLELVEPIDFSLSDATLASVTTMEQAQADAQRGHTEYPQIVMELQGRRFTSVAVFLRRT
jgi:SAM-dependent methyltransferase